MRHVEQNRAGKATLIGLWVRRVEWAIEFAHWTFVAVTLLYAIVVFAFGPNFQPLLLLCFVPPLLACLVMAVNTIRKTNPGIIALGKAFLTAIAAGVFLGEQNVVLANLKPQFPGMPPQHDRILTFYFAAYMLFLGVLLPTYLLVISLNWHLRTRSPLKFAVCCVAAMPWLAALRVVVWNAPTILQKLS